MYLKVIQNFSQAEIWKFVIPRLKNFPTSWLWQIYNLNLFHPALIRRCANFSEYHLHRKQVVSIEKPIGAKGLILSSSCDCGWDNFFMQMSSFFCSDDNKKVEHMKNNFEIYETFSYNANFVFILPVLVARTFLFSDQNISKFVWVLLYYILL